MFLFINVLLNWSIALWQETWRFRRSVVWILRERTRMNRFTKWVRSMILGLIRYTRSSIMYDVISFCDWFCVISRHAIDLGSHPNFLLGGGLLKDVYVHQPMRRIGDQSMNVYLFLVQDIRFRRPISCVWVERVRLHWRGDVDLVLEASAALADVQQRFPATLPSRK